MFSPTHRGYIKSEFIEACILLLMTKYLWILSYIANLCIKAQHQKQRILWSFISTAQLDQKI